MMSSGKCKKDAKKSLFVRFFTCFPTFPPENPIFSPPLLANEK